MLGRKLGFSGVFACTGSQPHCEKQEKGRNSFARRIKIWLEKKREKRIFSKLRFGLEIFRGWCRGVRLNQTALCLGCGGGASAACNIWVACALGLTSAVLCRQREIQSGKRLRCQSSSWKWRLWYCLLWSQEARQFACKYQPHIEVYNSIFILISSEILILNSYNSTWDWILI